MAWQDFQAGKWQETIDVRDFIQHNYTPYTGDAAFLAAPTARTSALWQETMGLLAEENARGGVYDVDASRVATITAHGPGYINKDDEIIVGLQTDAPLKRGVIVSGGIRMAEQACSAYGYTLDPAISDFYHKHCTTHNDAVFRAYTPEMKLARKLGVITGLPDAYGRGRIIGDYRRVALYGTARLKAAKAADLAALDGAMDGGKVQARLELTGQIKALDELTSMAEGYGFDITRPAENALEATQWLYFGYLAAIKEQNGAAMSLGRVSTFLDIYLSRDLAAGILDEAGAQEIIDQLVIKLRLARHLRTPEYNELFAGDPLWVTEAIGGMGDDGRTLVSKSSFRILHTLTNLGPAPEPNLTILWTEALPVGFKQYCAKISLETSAIQYENDDLMRPIYGDDYAIACCVSAMTIGKQMQFFGARVNLAKALLMAINGGRDENSGTSLGPAFDLPQGQYLDYDEVRANYSQVLAWLAELYVNTMNVIHASHDRYAYENSQMALHDSTVERLMAFGVAGLSVAVDSLSAIRYGRVQVLRGDDGISTGFVTEGEYPTFGNNDPRVDRLAQELTHEFITELRKHQTYRDAVHTLSVLTITSNVMYGKKTGATPDGRLAGAAFAPGANPMHGRDARGTLAAIGSLTNISYDDCRDGISYTFSIVPQALGKTTSARTSNMVAILDGYAKLGGHHINVNIFDRQILADAMAHPEQYPQLTVRVSGYAVNFIKLSPAHQREVIARTFYEAI